MTEARRRLGAGGEQQAAEWYTARGYEVVARNWRCSAGEIDLILRGKGVTVFCEVKTRTSDAFGLPAEAVTPAKQRRIRRLALTWIDQTATQPAGGRGAGGRRGEIRFDVACVLAGAIEVIEDAF